MRTSNIYLPKHRFSQPLPQRIKTGWNFFWATLCCVITGLFLSSITMAQAPTSPTDCKIGCTSNDVQIITAYLSNSTGTKLASNFVCPGSGFASVYLTLELTTKTPRIGVVIYLKVKNFIPPVPPATEGTIGSEVATISQCFGIALNQPTK